MGGISFDINLTALLLVTLFAVGFFFLRRWRASFADPYIFFPDVTTIPHKKPSLITSLQPLLLRIALISFAVAFTDPHFFIEKTTVSTASLQRSASPPREGIAVYLVLDQSGSMKETVVMESPSKGLYTTSKIDLVKKVSTQFIMGDQALGLAGRPNDLIGLVFFARGAQVMTPLTLDHEALLRQLKNFREVQDKEQDGTSIGYAIFKTANLIVATKHYAEDLIAKGEPAYVIKNNVMILLTDGLQDPNPLDKGKRLRNMDVPEAAAYAKEQGIRLYIVNIDPLLSAEKFAPYQHIMQRAAESTGGKFYMVDSNKNLEQIYADIDKLEKSTLPPVLSMKKEDRPDLYQRVSPVPYLISFALACFLVSIALETLFIRRVP